MADDADAERFFESEVRPILVERCSRCHGEKKQSGALRIDSRGSLLAGGDSGAAITPGDPAASLMIQAVRREGDLQMPPDEPLPADEVATLTQWVKIGAPWPESSLPLPATGDVLAETHWAFQPVVQPQIPAVQDSAWVRTPIDAFILARLEQSGLPPSPQADRRTLIRRASYALTGLPPSPEEVRAFVNDPDPLAYESLVDRLLDSPRYGEQWARHWLDVARYSDTKGYVYAREERFWVHAWAYRDWVAEALNKDLPYDRFLLLQIAADQVQDREDSDLAAMGFLTLGRRFLGVQRDIIDDRIDVVTRGAMGLTVACARCHDHKYDPIPTADYYSLYGVFDSCREQMARLGDAHAGDEAYEKELQQRRDKLQTALAEARVESSARARERVGDYLHAQTELHKYPADGFDQVFQKSDLLPAFVRRWESRLHEALRQGDPVFVPWHAYAAIRSESFTEQAVDVTRRLRASELGAVNPLASEKFAAPPESFADVIARYTELFKSIDGEWRSALEAAEKNETAPPRELADAAAEQLRRLLYGPQAPCEVPDEPIVHTETFFDSGTVTELWKLQGEVDRWIINSEVAAPYALTLVDRPVAKQPRIFRRGNPLNLGEVAPRQFLSLLAGEDRQPFKQGSGRLELAQAIIDPGNPLTARVIVNRVWAHHFGVGLVSTPSDFGVRAETPSHPELLDWLASEFVAQGWSLKKLHRWILTSAAFRQSSAAPQHAQMLARAQQLDPANRLLWRMNSRRLTFEEFRDSLLAAAGRLDLAAGGKPAPLFEQPFPIRRTLYGLVDRQFLPGALRMFDFANPDLHTPERNETTVPQQALFFLNHPMVLEQARALASRAAEREQPEEIIRALFERAHQRAPTDAELSEALALIEYAEQTKAPTPPPTVADWQYGYGVFDEQSERVASFTKLPHFTGSAWQGGDKWPDEKLGWVQLTAEGGHPGNDRQHAAVRRWTAPRAMTVNIRSSLIHEPAAGDGIRAFLVSSRSGKLQAAQVHQQSVDLHAEEIEVEPGDTIDFVVDIGDVLNSDQYLWSAEIQPAAAADDALTWNSQSDFPHATQPRLTPWEQLAHVLLCTNEFLFVD